MVGALACLLTLMGSSGGRSRTDPYADPKFVRELRAGLDAFYGREFSKARADFVAAHDSAPADAFAMSLVDAAAANMGSAALAALTDRAEAAVVRHPKNARAQAELGFAYLFERQTEPGRAEDAKDALNAALAAAPSMACAHVGLGIYRLSRASTNRAKLEFLAALRSEPHDVLAQEYLAVIYQHDLDDPERALSYIVSVPNFVTNYADGYYRLGSIMRDLRQYEAAEAYLRTAIDLDRGHVGEAGRFGLPLLGDVYVAMRRFDEAKKAFAQAVVYGEEPAYSQAQLEKIKHGNV
ncbi:MAG: hypothetical protein GIW99_02390 [Candidatus Eremiobacteraeota bacterium]|nr:hypothetical protein [Candidatus Eremiobacteraeota bacterium]MBC5826524.1 hypothetical protein [Candidatus Eremiobacteraeota bacterium]